jgi:Abortive infection alpha
MVEPISTGAALVAVGGWFANKLLGPTADALGEQIKVFASARLTAILKRTEQLTIDEVLHPLPPGFALQYVQKASISEEDEALTEAWANLLANASRKFDSRYNLFVDMLSLMTASEAHFFASLFEISTLPHAIENVQRLSGFIEANYPSVGGPFEFVGSVIDHIRSVPLGFRGAVRRISMPYNNIETASHPYGIEVWNHDRDAEIDALIRNGLLREFSINGDKPYDKPGVMGVVVTALGEQFYAACGGNS